jgi:radical SAM protein with 4Fe4S-binding SPASM domain
MRRVMEVTTNVGCANLCEYCPQETNIAAYKKRSRGRVMRFSDFEVCLAKLPSDVAIYFAGSAEPFLNREGLRMVEHACERGYEVHVYTTLIGLDEAAIDRLSRKAIYVYVIHLPSKTLKENYFADDNYLRVLRYFDSHIDQSKVDYMALDQVAESVRKTLAHRSIREDKKEHMSDFGGNLTVSYVPHHSLKGKIFCGQDRLYWNILYPNGDVTICCEDFGMKHVLGNLLTGTYDSLHSSAEFERVVSGMSDESIDILCRSCEYASVVKTRPAKLIAKIKSLVPSPMKTTIKSLIRA